jgi:uncharacterized protein YceK
MKLAHLITALGTTVLAGCSTVYTLVEGTNAAAFDCSSGCAIPRIYSGVAYDAWIIRNGAEEYGIAVIAVLDLPFSAVADTVVLPYALVMQAEHGSLCGGNAEAGE